MGLWIGNTPFVKMDANTKRYYQKQCFGGRSLFARTVDNVFLCCLIAGALFILGVKSPWPFLIGMVGFLIVAGIEKARWSWFEKRLFEKTAQTLQRESWMRQKAEELKQPNKYLAYPTPENEELIGLCLRLNQGVEIHSFGNEDKDKKNLANAWGHSMVFHAFMPEEKPSMEEIEKRIEKGVKKNRYSFRQVAKAIPINRFFVSGIVLLVLSIFLRRAMYWRLMGSLCLSIGVLRFSFQTIQKQGSRKGTPVDGWFD